MHYFEAQVIRGRKRGRRMGFPTINLNKEDLDISYGVYLVEIIFNKRRYKGLLHFGPKKTFNEGVSAEVYIKDFNLDIYRRVVKIKVVRKIREIKKFKSVEELKMQIRKDVKKLEVKSKK